MHTLREPHHIGGTMTTESTPLLSSTIDVMPWSDPTVERRGYPIGDPYIEMFWLPVLGPTATWLLRRLATGLDHEPQGYTVHMEDLARAIGVSYTHGRHNPFARALQRCVMFGVAQQISVIPHTTLAVRTVLPALSHRHIMRLPEQLQIAHADWNSIQQVTHAVA